VNRCSVTSRNVTQCNIWLGFVVKAMLEGALRSCFLPTYFPLDRFPILKGSDRKPLRGKNGRRVDRLTGWYAKEVCTVPIVLTQTIAKALAGRPWGSRGCFFFRHLKRRVCSRVLRIDATCEFLLQIPESMQPPYLIPRENALWNAEILMDRRTVFRREMKTVADAIDRGTAG
jgi:hypothetical protein